MKEIWKDIENYEGLYQVSNFGNVKNKNNKILKCSDNKGYKVVHLYKNKITKAFKVHRLVAKAFIPNIENKEQVDHINEIKHDNREKNLRWVSNKENMIYYYKNHKREKTKKILQLDLNDKLIKKWKSCHEIENELKINHKDIISCCKGYYKTYKNYKWKFENIVKEV